MQSINEVNADIDNAIKDTPPRNITAASMRVILKKVTTFLNDLTYNKLSAWFTVGTGLPSLNATDDVYRTGKVIIGTNADDGSGAKVQVSGRFNVNTGTFHKIKATNADGLYPIDYISEAGAGQLQFAANWVGGLSDMALVNTNLASPAMTFWRMTGATTKKMLLMLRDGAVGIGINNPTEALHVEGNTYINGILKFPTTLGLRKIALYGGNANDHQFLGFGIDAGMLRYQIGATTDTHAFSAGLTPATSMELMRIQGNGKVGVGTTTPRGMFDVNGEIITSYRMTMCYNNLSTSPTFGIDNYTDLFRIIHQLDMSGTGGAVFVSITNAGFMAVGVNMGNATSQLHVKATTGHQQLRLETPYTPTSTSDTNGAVGQVAWDTNYFYVKTTAGWKRSALTTF